MNKLILLVLFSLVGCSANWPHNYKTTVPILQARGPGQLVVLVVDERKPVQKGEIAPFTVGTVKALYGKSWEMVTAGNEPLGKVMAEVICASFEARDFTCQPVEAARSSLQDQVRAILYESTPQHILVLKIIEWNAEVLTTTVLKYNFDLEIIDNNGASRAIGSISGEDTLGIEKILNPARNASHQAPKSLKQILEMLLNDSKILRILNSSI